MRSSKSRSRNKNNRRSVGNIVNRVFDSSGPEGKVRGTPQQIIDKYLTLARDAQLANDRVAVENFQQHAEHYTRMLSEALREQEARREQQEQQKQSQRENREQRDNRGDRRGNEGQEAPQAAKQDPAEAPQPEVAEAPAAASSAPDVIDLGDGGEESGLVETPESKPARKPRTRSRRKKTEDAPAEASAEAAADPAPETPAAE